MSEQPEVSIIKLMDGSTVVGNLYYGDDSVEIEHPIELVSTIRPNEGFMGEQVSLRPWIAIAQESVFIVERLNIITIGLLDENFVAGYERRVEAIYKEDRRWEGDLYRADREDFSLDSMDEETQQDLDIETLTELAEAVIKKQIH